MKRAYLELQLYDRRESKNRITPGSGGLQIPQFLQSNLAPCLANECAKDELVHSVFWMGVQQDLLDDDLKDF